MKAVLTLNCLIDVPDDSTISDDGSCLILADGTELTPSLGSIPFNDDNCNNEQYLTVENVESVELSELS